MKGLLKGHGGVAAAGDPHGLVHVGPAGQGVPDGAAQTGGRPAEGLDLRGVVVGLVLKLDEPGLGLAVDGDRGLDGAGVDLLALVQIGHQALFPQVLPADGGQSIRETGLSLPWYSSSAGRSNPPGPSPPPPAGAFLHLDGIEPGQEGGVAAVVAPIGVDDPQLGDGGVRCSWSLK